MTPHRSVLEKKRNTKKGDCGGGREVIRKTHFLCENMKIRSEAGEASSQDDDGNFLR